MEIKVSELLETHDLALRTWANDFFKILGQISSDDIVLDFTGIDFMSRSFANEYLMLKMKSSKKIVEKNLGSILEEMLQYANIKPRSYPVQVKISTAVAELL